MIHQLPYPVVSLQRIGSGWCYTGIHTQEAWQLQASNRNSDQACLGSPIPVCSTLQHIHCKSTKCPFHLSERTGLPVYSGRGPLGRMSRQFAIYKFVALTSNPPYAAVISHGFFPVLVTPAPQSSQSAAS